MPNVDAANITYNALRTVAGGGITVGGMLLGAARSAHIMTPSATVRRIVNMTAVAVAVIAEKYNTIFVDTQDKFNQLLQHCHSASIAWDRVHPNTIGHMVIARAFLDAVRFTW
jgi:lysophospholipase L1-like esterase